MKLTKKQIKTLNKQVVSEKTRVEAGLDELSGDKYLLNSDDRFDEVDQAASDYARSQALRFRNRDAFYKKKLQKAFDKFDSEEFGLCEECDETIKFERLLARPTAELCITCKDDAERTEQGNFVARQSKSSEKPDIAMIAGR